MCLIGSAFSIVFKESSGAHIKVDKQFFVEVLRSVGRKLLLFIKEYVWQRK